eukprot:Gb_18042 [translate_table: standard]
MIARLIRTICLFPLQYIPMKVWNTIGYDVDTRITYELNLPTKPFVFSLHTTQKELSQRNSNVAIKEEGPPVVERSKDVMLNGKNEGLLEEPIADIMLESQKEMVVHSIGKKCVEGESNDFSGNRGKLEGPNPTGNDSSCEELSNISSPNRNDADLEKDNSTLPPVRFLLYSHGSLNTFYAAFEFIHMKCIFDETIKDMIAISLK